MDLRVNLRAVDVIRKITAGEYSKINFVKFEPWKKSFSKDVPYKQPFPRSTPEEQGISSKLVSSFLSELTRTPETCVHSFMILRNGNVIAEGSFAPYKQEIWHISNSLCKSIVALAVGIAMDEGRLTLDSKLNDLLKNRKVPVSAKLKRDITVKHLLTMTSGLYANESVAATENEWTKVLLESGQRFNPGTKFHYNSMNTYLLSVILTEVTGESVMDYIRPRLLEPMGIDRIAWEKSPEGIEKGGWGMYITLEDMAKFGQLCLQRGEWKGKQLVPARWIEEMAKFRMDSTGGKGMYGYGYHVWLGKRAGSFIFNGMLGQIVYVIPDLKMVFAFTGGSENLYRDNATNFLIEKYFDEHFSGEVLKPDLNAAKALKKQCKTIAYVSSDDYLTEKYGVMLRGCSRKDMRMNALKLCDKSYSVSETTVGLFPLYVQCIHNNYSKGISKLNFKNLSDRFFFEVVEGDDINSFPVGFEEPEYTTIHENGEEFNVAVIGTMDVNEDRETILKIAIHFLETVNVRIIKFRFTNRYTSVKFYETPSVEMILDSIDSVAPKLGGTSTMLNNAINKIDPDIAEAVVRYAFEPKLKLTEIGPGAEEKTK